jgi:hypothetical protein
MLAKSSRLIEITFLAQGSGIRLLKQTSHPRRMGRLLDEPARLCPVFRTWHRPRPLIGFDVAVITRVSSKTGLFAAMWVNRLDPIQGW